MKHGRIFSYPLTYSYERDRILTGITEKNSIKILIRESQPLEKRETEWRSSSAVEFQ